MKKVVVGAALVFGLILLALLGLGGKAFYDGFMKGYRNSGIPADFATRPWNDSVELGTALVVPTPYKLSRTDLPVDAEARKLIREAVNYSGKEGSMFFLCGMVTYQDDVELDLDAAAEAGATGMSAQPGFKVLGSTKTETTMLGNRAIEVLAHGSALGRDFHLRAIYFAYYGRFVQVMFLAPKDNAPAAAAWERVKQGIAPKAKSATLGGNVGENGGLPSGMRPRK